MFKFFIKQDPVDSIILGITRNIITALISIALEFIIIYIFFLYYKERQWLSPFFYIISIPGGFLISGVYNGILLAKNRLPKSAKTNFIIAFICFLFSWIFTSALFR